MKRLFSVITPPSSPQHQGPQTQPDFSTPADDQRSGESSRELCCYPQYATPADLVDTPIKHARRGHDYKLVRGLPQLVGNRPLVLDTFISNDSPWPRITDARDFENFVMIPGHPNGLLDTQNRLVIKFRAVIDCEGKLIFAKNGPGARTIPFHHQLSFSSIYNDEPVLSYETVIKRSLRPVIFAGEIGFGSDNLIHYVSNFSGHFCPDASSLNAVWDCFALNGSCLASKVLYQVYANSPNESPAYEKSREEILAREAHLTPAQRQLLWQRSESVYTVESQRQAVRAPATPTPWLSVTSINYGLLPTLSLDNINTAQSQQDNRMDIIDAWLRQP